MPFASLFFEVIGKKNAVKITESMQYLKKLKTYWKTVFCSPQKNMLSPINF